MKDLFSQKVREEFLKYNQNLKRESSPQNILDHTEMISYCGLYIIPEQKEEGRMNWIIRDILDFTNYLSILFPLETVKRYLSLFSEQSHLYGLHQWFTEKSLPISHFSHVSYSINRAFSGIPEQLQQPQNLENTIKLLNTDQAKVFHLQYGSYVRAYEAVVVTALENPAKAEEIIACLNNKEYKKNFFDHYLTFPENVWSKMSSENRGAFRDSLLAKTMQDPNPKAVAKFLEKNKRRWIAIFKEEGL